MRHYYVAIVGTLLVAVALIAGIVVYGQPEPKYIPMIAVGPEIELAKWNLIKAAL
jgi:hypothetical protein